MNRLETLLQEGEEFAGLFANIPSGFTQDQVMKLIKVRGGKDPRPDGTGIEFMYNGSVYKINKLSTGWVCVRK